MANKIEFTSDQQEVVDFSSNNMLVSAAAGSGKTTVMIYHIIKLILDKKIPISRFLVISFTKASASDMKNKLIKELSKQEPSAFILEQLDDVLTSDVSNLHSFCARLLKLYFYEVGLDPSFVVLDEVEVSALKEKALIKLFNQKAQEGNKDFYELIEIFSKSRSDMGLKEVVLTLYDFLCSIYGSEKWFENTINSLYDADFKTNSAAKVINSHLIAERNRMAKEVNEAIERCLKLGQPKFVEYLQALDTKIKQISSSDDFYHNAKRLEQLEKMPAIPKQTEENAEVFEFVNSLKESVNARFKKLKEYALVGEVDDIKDNLIKTQAFVFALYGLVKDFEVIFKELKKEKGGLDFNDLEQYALKVLDNPIILEEVHNKYDYVLVDEYQDINGVQEEILTRVSKQNNRFMVGDIKQSIYRFRLCDPEIFLTRYNAFKNNNAVGVLKKLNANFRSKSGILDFVNEIFDAAMTENFGGVNYKEEARLVAGRKEQIDKEKRVQIMFADTSSFEKEVKEEIPLYSVREDEREKSVEINGSAEGVLVAKAISDIIKNGKVIDEQTGKQRHIRFSDITILTGSRNKTLSKIVETLEKHGIPVSTDIEGDCFEDEYVYGIKSFLEIIACPKVDLSLFNCMYSKIFNFSANDLAKIKIASKDEKFFFQSVFDCKNNGLLDQTTKSKLDSFFEIFDEYRNKCAFLSVREIVSELVLKLDIKLKINFEEDGEKRAEKLSKFMNSLPDISVYEYLGDLALASVKSEPTSSGNSVKVMTIHKSKGLEFKVTILVEAFKKFNLESLRNDILICKDLGVGMDFYDLEQRYKTSTLAKQAVRLVETKKLLEEQQRLLYVALTRATDYLYIIGSGNFENIKSEIPASPMNFMDFMGDLVLCPQKHENLSYDTTVVDAKNIIDADTDASVNQVIVSDTTEKEILQMKDVFNKKYDFAQNINVPVKTAVTRLSAKNIENQTYRVLYQEAEGGSSVESGTVNHLILSKLDLSKTSEEEIKTQVYGLKEDGVISAEELTLVNFDGIGKLLKNNEFQNLLTDADKILKEKEFFMWIDSADVDSSAKAGDKVVVQGIVDLAIIKNGKIIIVDYKTGFINDEKLEAYAKQVRLYATAISKSYKMDIDKMFIASINTGKIIEIKKIPKM
ncbi:MAG: UvrD-helicase domain-containing protein [Clostridia bacterium]|nr:UvrD-helicase domain-containing protein [Clostridia bacterium]